MSGTTPVQPGGARPAEMASWIVREATLEDVAAVACAVSDLLVELGGKPAPIAELEEATRVLIRHPEAGILLVADADAPGGASSAGQAPPDTPPSGARERGVLAGVLGASWQHAIRIPGRYGLIQELWVHPSWRGRMVGGDLILALFDHARARGVTRLEVGLPSERFPHLAATEAFYLNNGFTTIGLRMRRLL